MYFLKVLKVFESYTNLITCNVPAYPHYIYFYVWYSCTFLKAQKTTDLEFNFLQLIDDIVYAQVRIYIYSILENI